MLAGAWRAAFVLLARDAEAKGDEALARVWAERLDQLEEASRTMSKASMAEMSKLVDD